jgi:methylmalonyl-CoA mutase N-terminal domain/subunit
MRFHTQTAGSTLTAQQIDNNVVRVTMQAMAAVLGGTQSLHTNGKDEALALPTEASARLALRTQQVIAHESGLADIVDPLGGSWAVERLTDELEEQALKLIAEVDELGGMVSAIEAGFPQRRIQQAAYKTQLDVDAGKQVVVGVNRFKMDEPKTESLLTVDPDLEDGQVSRTAAYRKRQDRQKVSDALARLQDSASGTDNLMPLIVDGVGDGCTLGEISHALRDVFGVHRETLVL